jgi:hypothetical protein
MIAEIPASPYEGRDPVSNVAKDIIPTDHINDLRGCVRV